MNTLRTSRRMLLCSALALPFATARADEPTGPLTAQQRQRLAFERRRDAAQAEFTSQPPVPATNGDEERYPDRRASFTKTLPQNDLGEVDPVAYQSWLAILASGDPAQFDRAPRDPRGVERLNNPQATYATDLVGADATALPLRAPPAFASEAAATEMTELYWLALTRDVPFRDYGTDPLAAAAMAELHATSLFRSQFAGDLLGPFVSQFLLLDVPFGPKTLDQRYRVPIHGQDFMTEFADWLACQRGEPATATVHFAPEPHYIATYRDLTEFVHRDFSFQAFMNAALIALHLGGDDVLSPSNPYRGSRRQFGDITFGNKDLLSMIAQASLLAQKTAYFQKWQLHRRARPECIGGRIDAQQAGRRSYDLHPAVLHSDALARIRAKHGSFLLPVAYPEGCPTHPSYPAAHAVNAGACATVLKAFLDESYPIEQPVEASADGARLEPWSSGHLRLGGEIDKLASNIALACDAAGVHLRSDSIEGLNWARTSASPYLPTIAAPMASASTASC
jgi:hypothetical protein